MGASKSKASVIRYADVPAALQRAGSAQDLILVPDKPGNGGRGMRRGRKVVPVAIEEDRPSLRRHAIDPGPSVDFAREHATCLTSLVADEHGDF